MKRSFWMKNRIVILVASACLLLLALGWYIWLPELDTSLLTDDPCSVPCWSGIEPGSSTESDVRELLADSPFVRKGTVQHSTTEQSSIPLSYFSWKARGRELNRVYLRDGRVLRIQINMNYGLTLGEIVERYGAPERVYAHLGGAEYWGYLIILYYPTRGIAVRSYSLPVDYDEIVLGGGQGLLSEDFEATEVIYFSPMTFEDMLRNIFLDTDESLAYFMNRSYGWQGFGSTKLAQ